MTLDGKRILIVEDNTIIAMDLVYEVGAAGAKVVAAVGTVDAALDIIATTELDAAILDIYLHGQTGFRVADALADRHIPFIFESGRIKRRDLPVRHAAVPFVEKPFGRNDLCRRMLESVMRAPD